MNAIQVTQSTQISQEPNRCNIFEVSRNTKTTKKKTKGFTSDGRPVPKPADSIKTIEEVNLIRNYFLDKNEYRNYMLWMIGICTAYRCGDILSFKFSNIFEDDKITFRKYVYIHEEKTNKPREMEITQPMQEAINKYISSLNIPFELDDYLFTSRKGINQSLNVRSVQKIFTEMGKELNLPYDMSTHTMRKTYAYWFLMTHKNDITALTTLMELLNHSSERITLAYAGISKESRRNMSRDVSNLWESI